MPAMSSLVRHCNSTRTPKSDSRIRFESHVKQSTLCPLLWRSESTPQSGRRARRCNVISAAADYVPSPLDPSVAASQISVIVFIATALPAAWWLIVVPTSRKKLAKDKRKGPLREFLEKVDVEGDGFSRWFFAKWLTQMPGRDKARRRNLEAMGYDADQIELQETGTGQSSSPTSSKSTSSVENFLSGDNPIIVVMGVLGIFVAVQIALHPR
eukprot:jgi/Ulvmu1/11167/UM072_0003.1